MTIVTLVCSALIGCGGSAQDAGVVTVLDVPQAPPVVATSPPAAQVIPDPAPVVVVPPPPVQVAPAPEPTPPVVVAPTPVPATPSGPTLNLPGLVASVLGFTNLRVRQADQDPPPVPSDDGVGAFRNPCGFSHMAFDDPIVFPGRTGASHLHTFFGNTSTNAFSTTVSLFAAGSSTCAGGVANLSAYWVPAMVDTATNKALAPFENLIYYKTGYNQIPRSSLRSPPSGLRFIGGNSPANAAAVSEWDVHHSFLCNGQYETHSQSIPPCPVGGYIQSSLDYPNCWDGVNLDSPDHRSHMAYSGGGACPASHPVAIPSVQLNIKYAITAGQDVTKWKLASDNYTGPGGYSMHGDLWFNWQTDIADTWMNNCVKSAMDCHGFLLGDGRATY
ncbi:MAG: DUF1996 domain-containing protein [Pseudomonadota bacterium]